MIIIFFNKYQDSEVFRLTVISKRKRRLLEKWNMLWIERNTCYSVFLGYV